MSKAIQESGKNEQAASAKAASAETEREPKLHGTFAAVLLLGAFLAISWLAVFLLFLIRQ